MFVGEEQVGFRMAGRCPICKREIVEIQDISSMDNMYKIEMSVRVIHPNLRSTQCHEFMRLLAEEQNTMIQDRIREMTTRLSNGLGM